MDSTLEILLRVRNDFDSVCVCHRYRDCWSAINLRYMCDIYQVTCACNRQDQYFYNQIIL